jgi:hypothetical protein
MATDTPSRSANGMVRNISGTATGDGTALVVTLGFRPQHVIVLNETDAIRWEKIDGQADANSFKTVTAGTLTKDTTSAIVISDTGFTISAAAAANAKALVYFAS